MKKLLFITALLIVINLVFSQTVSSQENKSPEDILVGKWILTVKEMASYDINLSLDVKNADGIFNAEVGFPVSGEKPNEFNQLVLTDSTFYVEIYFDALLVPMPLSVTVKDENSLSGTLYGYSLKGKREEQ
ncbi:MAG: hypothetical protein RBS38_12010 [Bacteroidales bacterium]|jgi:hypothetical protein|nr:hypothetical protein [Bacteroidales bacterium]